jgi:phosphoglycerate dehydrogenase-like enzyme
MAESPPLIVSTSPPPAEFFEGLLPGARVVKAGSAELQDAVEGAAVIIGDWEHRVRIGADVIARAARCRLIQQPSAGFENIDVDAAAAAGIPVANAGPANAAAVAEHAVMLVLGCLRHLPDAMRDTAAGGWSQEAWIGRDLPDLAGRTVGVLGLGGIGQALARRLRGFECQVLYNKRNRLPPQEEADLGVAYAELETMLRQSEVLVICLPLTAATRGLVSADRLALLPRDAIVVNVARGDVLDYDALADQLRSGRLGGAGLDVFPEEPLPVGHKLGELPNVILTPHVGGATASGKRNILLNSIGNINRVLAGEAPQFVVNEPAAR